VICPGEKVLKAAIKRFLCYNSLPPRQIVATDCSRQRELTRRMSFQELKVQNQTTVSSNWRPRKNSICALVLGTLVALGMLIVNLPYQYVEVSDDSYGIFEYSVLPGSHNITPPKMAGWPFRYWVQYSNGDVHDDRYWSPTSLYLNIAIAMAAILAVLGFLRFRQLVALKSRSAAMMDIGIAIAILALPGGIVASDYLNWQKQKAIIDSVGKNGATIVSCWLPELIADQVPESWRQYKTRIRHALLTHPDEQLVQTMATIPTLQRLQI
jgi:hypothetical protein